MDSLDFLDLERGPHTNRSHLLDQSHPRYNHMDSIGRPGMLATEQFANMFVDKDRYVNDDILFESIDFEAGAATAVTNETSTDSRGVDDETHDLSEYRKLGSNNSHSDSSADHSVEGWRLFVSDMELLSGTDSLSSPSVTSTVMKGGGMGMGMGSTSPATTLLSPGFTGIGLKARVSSNESPTTKRIRRRNPFYSPSNYVKRLINKKRGMTMESKASAISSINQRKSLKKSLSFAVLPLRPREPNVFSRDSFPLD